MSLTWSSFIGQFVHPVVGNGVKGWMMDIIIIASCEIHFMKIWLNIQIDKFYDMSIFLYVDNIIIAQILTGIPQNKNYLSIKSLFFVKLLEGFYDCREATLQISFVSESICHKDLIIEMLR